MATTPVETATSAAPARSTVGSVGPITRSIPTASSSSRNPLARPSPSSTPTIPPASPAASASIRTAATTWRRLAPTVRSNAYWRVRWATVIVNVVNTIMPAASTVMPAKMSSPTASGPMDCCHTSPKVSRACTPAGTTS